jgi:carbon monoxide dehydrogenase subunit G
VAEDIDITVRDDDGLYTVEGMFFTNVPDSVVWSVLTDYDRIGQFVSSIKSSTTTRNGDGQVRIKQQARVGFLFVNRTLQVDLDVEEEFPRRIKFRDAEGKDFHIYIGAWSLGDAEGGTAVRYSLEARPKAAVPHMVARRVMRGDAKELLVQVRDEIARRGALAQERRVALDTKSTPDADRGR